MENEFHDGLQITFCGYVVHFNLDNQTGLMTHFMFKTKNAELLNIINIKPTAIKHTK